ncbi:hypothetical protein LUZ63_021269 [Rhynchospora breviuscula]|uniref:glucose-1-phosphate adenylyltransferase n=1 Tax=Rhynchospora breviuscula TaxID=2022672 RepID=A0A9P9Z6Y3_9POAL|nr:hypothetical protein LUZ63_021269 [Rhynchospora breviuscula]
MTRTVAQRNPRRASVPGIAARPLVWCHACSAEGLRNHPRRRRGKATHAPHGRSRQTRRPLRRPVPPDRLRHLEPHQFGPASARRADAVQVAQPRPSHLADVAHVADARVVRGIRPRPAAPRKALVLGSADAILQSMNLIRDEKPDIVVVIGADHVYRMDFAQMLDAHIASDARATVAGIRQPISLANQFGVIDTDPSDPTMIREFLEKPQNPTGLADAPHEVLASMGNYIFDADALVEAVNHDGELPTSAHDMGGDIVPYFVDRGEAAVYDFQRNDVPGSTSRDRSYWRDTFNAPPAKFVRDSVGRIGNAIDLDRLARVGALRHAPRAQRRGPVGPRRRRVDDHRLGALRRRAGGCRGADPPRDPRQERHPGAGATIGVDRERDLARGFTVTETGITVVGKDVRVEG